MHRGLLCSQGSAGLLVDNSAGTVTAFSNELTDDALAQMLANADNKVRCRALDCTLMSQHSI